MGPAIPAAGAGPGGTPAASNVRGHKRIPSPSRRRDLPLAAAAATTTTRPPLFPAAEKDNNNSVDNAAVLRRPRSKEISSRYLSSSSPSRKGGSLGSPSSSTGSSYSKGGFFTTSSCSTTSSSSSGTSSSFGRRFPSPISTPRPSTSPALSKNSVPRRSKSVDRTRAATPAAAAPRVAELSSAARTLCTASTTTRSLSVSFQGESFSYQTSKARSVSPSPNRKPTPERRKPAPSPSATPASSISRSESSRTFGSHHRWPAARSQQPNPLAKSLDCSLGNKDSILAAVRLLRQSMLVDNSTRRASFDGSDLSVSSCTDSSSSESSIPSTKGQATPRGITAKSSKERSSRLHRSPELVTPSKSAASSKLDPARKSLDNGSFLSLSMGSSPRYGSVRSSSPSRPVANSPTGMSNPQRLRNSPATSNSKVPQSSSTYSVASLHAEGKRGRNGDNSIEDARQLRLFYNKLLQWRWVNAHASDALFVQALTAEMHLYNAWITTAKLQESITTKKLKLLMEKQHMKLGSVFKGQMAYLEEWALIERDHAISLPGTIEALKSSIECLPVLDGAKANFQEMRNAVGSAVDVMQAIGTSICSILSKVENRSFIVTELVKLAKQEQALMHQCRDLLSVVAAMHVKQCSLLGHITQLQTRPSLIQL